MNSNLIAATIISIYKEEHPNLSEEKLLTSIKSLSTAEIRKYFDNPIVQSTPMILKAVDNLVDAIVLCIEQITTSNTKLEMLENELEQSLVLADEKLDLGKLKTLPVLDAFYEESIRFDSPVIVPRYTTNGFITDSITIPPHTMILFDLEALSKGEQYWKKPGEFDPSRFLNHTKVIKDEYGDKNFLQTVRKPGQFPFLPFFMGMRHCSTFAVTEFLFKAAVAKFVFEYKLQIVEKTEKDLIIQISSKVDSPGTEMNFIK